ncbi:MAG: cytochrome P450 [Gammaproteobacteria bacterium]|jgi:cytochrome P450|nr:cytochrome P450 [Gammaproteobacteria bacterium]MBT5600719.1 cytochrome P450 [Gammaproteobacteria bacterium]MBT6246626.1 cytochrome P450 [Gammaproteobacteria bacterium]
MTKTLDSINPFDPEVLACPYDFNHALRELNSVYLCPNTGVYFVSNYDLVVEVAKNEKRFSNKFSMIQSGVNTTPDPEMIAILKKGWPRVDTMLTADPPQQRRYRSLCQKPFSISSVAKIRPYIHDVANELIDQFISAGKCDWMESFAVPMPVRMIAYILGVPLSDMELFKQWSDANVASFSVGQTREEALRSAELVVDFQHYFADKIEARKIKPTGDVLSDIVNSSADGETPMDMAECLSVISQLLVAGNETTTSTFAEGMYLLAKNPEQLNIVQQQPELIPNMVEEMLRLSTPTNQMWRICLEDTQLAGVDIPKGATMMIKYGSANRDDHQFRQAADFDVTRGNLKTQIAFGQGVHHCLGAPLARQELTISFQNILRRITNIRLPEGEPELTFQPSLLLHGPIGLNIEFDQCE